MSENCILCGESLLHLKFHASDLLAESGASYPVLECRRCGLVRTLRPTSNSGSCYPEDYHRRISGCGGRQSVNRSDLLATRLRGLRQFKKRGRILDVGCGDGSFLRTLGRAGWEAVGTEIDSGLVSILRKQGLEVFEGELPELKLPHRYFDFITYYGSFEHVSRPMEELEEAKRILSEDGLLLFSLTNAGSVEAKLFGPNWFGFEVPRHRFNYPLRSLQLLLTIKGFQCLRADIQNDYFITTYSLACSLGLRSKYSALERPLNLFLTPFRAANRWFGGGNVIEVIASRPTSPTSADNLVL